MMVLLCIAGEDVLIGVHQKLKLHKCIKRTTRLNRAQPGSTETQHFPIELAQAETGKMPTIHLDAIKNGSHTKCRTVPMHCVLNCCRRFVYGFLITI